MTKQVNGLLLTDDNKLITSLGDSSTLDAGNNLPVTLGTKLDPINDGITTYSAGRYITPISSAATTQVATFPIYVDEIRILDNTTATGTVAVYDSTTGSGTNPIPSHTPATGAALLVTSAIFAVGCTVVTSAATKMIVIWRPQ